MSEARSDERTFDSIMRLLRARTGLVFRPDQQQNASRGIERAMARSNLSDVDQFARLLEFDVDVLDNLIVELTVGETYFYREPRQFEYLRRQVLPEILDRRGSNHTTRIWSAACASGEEPYSLAMLCDQERLAGRVSILATDISPEALEKARRATYRDWSMRSSGQTNAAQYLRKDGQQYQVEPRICRMVKFEFLNLALDVYPSFATGTKDLDLILCRNVLIYFDLETVRAVARRLFDSLSEGGWLFTASGDPSLADFAQFDLVVSEHGVFYRRPVKHSVAFPWDPPTSRTGQDVGESKKVNANGAEQAAADESQEFSAKSDHATGRDRQRSDAEAALAEGNYELVTGLTESILDDPVACVVHIKALANIDTERAVRRCGSLAERHSLSPDLHYLHAVLLMELNLDIEAVQAAQRVVFLDRSLAIGHALLGSILQRRGALEGARRAFRNAKRLCDDRPFDEPIPLSDNETAGELARAAEIQLATIEAALETNR